MPIYRRRLTIADNGILMYKKYWKTEESKSRK